MSLLPQVYFFKKGSKANTAWNGVHFRESKAVGRRNQIRAKDGRARSFNGFGSAMLYKPCRLSRIQVFGNPRSPEVIVANQPIVRAGLEIKPLESLVKT